jgi:hypothetical protein
MDRLRCDKIRCDVIRGTVSVCRRGVCVYVYVYVYVYGSAKPWCDKGECVCVFVFRCFIPSFAHCSIELVIR